MMKTIKSRHFFLFVMVGLTLPLAAQTMSQPLEKSKQLRAGYKGMSLDFDSDRVFYIEPNDRVDVVAVFDKNPAVGESIKNAATLIKRARVLAVKPSETARGRSSVLLEFAPNEAQYVELAAHSGNIWLSLRKNGDEEDAPMEAVSWGKILKSDAIPLPRDGMTPSSKDAISAVDRVPQDAAVRSSILAARNRMRPSCPALSLPIATDKVIFLQPGARVDILATIGTKDPKRFKAQKTTLTFLQNIFVLDVRESDSHPGQSILLLALNFNEIQYATLAWDTAEIQVLLRSTEDAEMPAMQPASLENLWR